MFKADAPLNTPRSYTPQIRTLADWRAYADAVGIDKGVLVQPSVYGFDNSVLVEALESDPERLRGVVVLRPDTAMDELRRLDAAGRAGRADQYAQQGRAAAGGGGGFRGGAIATWVGRCNSRSIRRNCRLSPIWRRAWARRWCSTISALFRWAALRLASM